MPMINNICTLQAKKRRTRSRARNTTAITKITASKEVCLCVNTAVPVALSIDYLCNLIMLTTETAVQPIFVDFVAYISKC